MQLAGITTAATVSGLWWHLHTPQTIVIGAAPEAMLVESGLGHEVDLLLHELQASSKLAQALPAQHEYSTQALDQLLMMLRERLDVGTQALTSAQFRAALQRTLSREFRAGDIVELEGWQLAQTELLLAAIARRLHPHEHAANHTSIESHIATISNWGPRQTTLGTAPNRFGPDGYSAFWFDMQAVPPWLQIAIDGTRLRSQYREQRVLVATFQGQLDFQRQLFNSPGEHIITLHDDVAGHWQQVASFTVLPAAASDALPDGPCQASDWGPKQTGLSQIANPQDHDKLGIWVDIDCAPADTVAVVGTDQFDTYQNKPGVITFAIPIELLHPGNIAIYLQSEQSGERQLLGELRVMAE